MRYKKPKTEVTLDIDSLYEAQTNAMLDDIYKDIDDREEEGIDEDEESFDCDTEEAQLP